MLIYSRRFGFLVEIDLGDCEEDLNNGISVCVTINDVQECLLKLKCLIIKVCQSYRREMDVLRLDFLRILMEHLLLLL